MTGAQSAAQSALYACDCGREWGERQTRFLLVFGSTRRPSREPAWRRDSYPQTLVLCDSEDNGVTFLAGFFGSTRPLVKGSLAPFRPYRRRCWSGRARFSAYHVSESSLAHGPHAGSGAEVCDECSLFRPWILRTCGLAPKIMGESSSSQIRKTGQALIPQTNACPLFLLHMSCLFRAAMIVF